MQTTDTNLSYVFQLLELSFLYLFKRMNCWLRVTVLTLRSFKGECEHIWNKSVEKHDRDVTIKMIKQRNSC